MKALLSLSARPGLSRSIDIKLSVMMIRVWVWVWMEWSTAMDFADRKLRVYTRIPEGLNRAMVSGSAEWYQICPMHDSNKEYLDVLQGTA